MRAAQRNAVIVLGLLLASVVAPGRTSADEPASVGDELLSKCSSINECVPILEQYAAKKGFLGVAAHCGIDEISEGRGAYKVGLLKPGGAAEGAGLRVGDRIVAMDGAAFRVDSAGPLSRHIDTVTVGQRVVFSVERGGHSVEIAIVAAAPTSEDVKIWVNQKLSKKFGFDAVREYRATKSG